MEPIGYGGREPPYHTLGTNEANHLKWKPTISTMEPVDLRGRRDGNLGTGRAKKQ